MYEYRRLRCKAMTHFPAEAHQAGGMGGGVGGVGLHEAQFVLQCDAHGA